MTTTQLTPWTMSDITGVYRAIAGTDESPRYRVAFIEKTPRIRIAPWTDQETDHLNWRSGPKGSGPHDENSRNWCDQELAKIYKEANDATQE